MYLLDQIRSMLDSSSEAEKKFARYVLAHEDVIYQSISEVIEDSGAGYGTVIRYCKKMGCSGFQDFKIRLAAESSLINQKSNDKKKEVEAGDLLEPYITHLRNTARILDQQQIIKVAKSIIEAQRILVIGAGGSYPTALELTYRLTRFGFCVVAEMDEHMQAIRASTLGKEDLLIVVSFSGSTKGILDTAQIAKNNRTKIVAITNYLRSPLVKLAEYYLLTAIWEQALDAEIVTRIPSNFIIDILTTTIVRNYPKAKQAIKDTSQGVSQKQI